MSCTYHPALFSDTGHEHQISAGSEAGALQGNHRNCHGSQSAFHVGCATADQSVTDLRSGEGIVCPS